jgi:Zn-dependent protease
MDVSIGNIALVIVSIILSMTFHEAMHAFVGHWLGDDTAYNEGRLTLNPLSHIDPIGTVLLPLALFVMGLPPFGAAKPVPFNPYKVRGGEWGAALVGLAGPVTNLVLAALAAIILGLTDGWLAQFWVLFISVNISFFVFNMIPFPPLDGSRVLYAIAPDGIRSIMRGIEGLGLIGIVAFMFLLFPIVRPFFLGVFSFFYDTVIRLALL